MKTAESNSLDKMKKKYQVEPRSASAIKNGAVNFQESFSHPEISTLKSEFHPYDSKVERLISKNEKLKNNPYYISTTNRFRSTSNNNFGKTKK